MGDDLPRLHYCGDFVVRRNWKLNERILEEHELVYFPLGTGTVYRCEDQIFTLNEPCWIVTRGGTRHSYIFSETTATRHQFFHFSGGESAAPALLESSGIHRIPVRDGAFHSQLATHLLGAAYSDHIHHRCSMLLSALLCELEHLSRENRTSPWPPAPSPNTGECENGTAAASPVYPLIVSKALSYIRSRLCGPVTVSEVAIHCKISHEHLTRMFVRSVGIPLRQMIIQLRLERAAHMLRHSTLNVKEIAAQCGYTENHYFSRAFAANFGMTAVAYRKKFADPLVQHVVYDGSVEEKHPVNSYIYLNPLYRS